MAKRRVRLHGLDEFQARRAITFDQAIDGNQLEAAIAQRRERVVHAVSSFDLDGEIVAQQLADIGVVDAAITDIKNSLNHSTSVP